MEPKKKKKAYDRVYNRFFKRVIDFVLALPFLIVAIPFYLIIGIAILIEDGRPVFYRPLRGGYKNKAFQEHKGLTAYNSFENKELKVA